MDIKKILSEYDSMFGKFSLSEIEEYLNENIRQAKLQNENFIQIALLNELIGLCRDTSQKKKTLDYCCELKELAEKVLDENAIDYATVLLNIANAYRAFEMVNEAHVLYQSVLSIYENNSDVKEYLYASLFNNWSHVYQMRGNCLKAKELLEKALYILMKESGNEIQQAITRVNLATALLKMGGDVAYVEAMNHLLTALGIFEKDAERDFHYSAALVAMGDACSFKKDLHKAKEYYHKGLQEIEKHVGRNSNYLKTLAKYNEVSKKIIECDKGDLNIDRCYRFYEAYGKDMIRNEFPEYESRIAVGLVGEGSDCFGFDDDISKDHDYAPGFCMWLTNEDYEKVGARLQSAYEKLVEKVYEYKPTDGFLKERRGVLTIKGFYSKLLGVSEEDMNISAFPYWSCSEDRLAAATNGQVFRDDLGIFNQIRNKLLEHYPDDYFRRKIAQEIHSFSQCAQSNYPRMMARGDQLSANLCINKAIESVMNIFYLLNKKYAPYYKWKRKGLENLEGAERVIALMDAIAATPCQKKAWEDAVYSASTINTEDRIVVLFENVAHEILEFLKEKGLVSKNELFLETHIPEIIKGKQSFFDQRQELIIKVMQLEWKQFDKVHNEGGRALCQDDYETFKIMRLSQYMTWPENLLYSFYNDLQKSEKNGWNLITEKYGRMMKNTDPAQYKLIEEQFPILSEERHRLQEMIIQIQVNWMEQFATEFPAISGGSRKIHSYEDTPYETSYETYLRGEISTYSNETFIQYTKFITDAMNDGRNITREIMKNTVVLYGYKSLEDAEWKKNKYR